MKNKLLYYLKKLRTPFFLAAIILSFVGSWQLYAHTTPYPLKNLGIIVNSVIKLFAFFPTNGVDKPAPLAYELAIWMAPTTTLVGFFSMFTRLYESLRMSIFHMGARHLVLMGENERTYTFLSHLKKEYPEEKVLLLVGEGDEIDEERLTRLSVKILRLDYRNPESPMNHFLLHDAHVGERGIIISFEEDPTNYGRITALHTMIGEGSVIDLYVATQDPRLKEMVAARLDALNRFDIHYFSLGHLIIKKLMQKEDLFLFPGAEADLSRANDYRDIAEKLDPYRILIIGFSPITRHYLTYCSNCLTLNPIRKLQVTLLGEGVEKAFQNYADASRLIERVFDLTVKDISGTKDLLHILEGDNNYHSILFSHEDAKKNVIYADRLLERYMHVPIAIYAANTGDVSTIMESFRRRHSNITLFGDIQQVLTTDLIIKEKLLRKAKHFNAYYNSVAADLMGWSKSTQTVEEQWLSLSTIKKESSENQAEHRRTKKRVLEAFCRLPQFPDTPDELLTQWEKEIQGLSVLQQVDRIENDPYMNFMTAMEHARWNHFYYMKDFIFGEEKNEIKKTHDCLIEDWDGFMRSKQREKAIYDFISVLSLKNR